MASSTNRAIGLRLAVCVIGALFAFPAAYLVWRNFTTESDPLGVLFSDRTLPPLWRTLRLAVSVSVACATLGTALAWLTARTDVPGRRLWQLLLPLPLVYPTFVAAAAFVRTLNPGGLANDLLSRFGVERTPQLSGFSGAWLVLVLFSYPYVYLPVAARLRALPASLEESARLLGDSGWGTFRRVVLPQAASAIAAGTLLVFLYVISDFGAVQVMRYDTLTRAIWTTRLNDQRVSLALSMILLAVAITVTVAERAANKRLPATTRTGVGRPLRMRLERWRIPAALFVGTVVLFGLVAPFAALADWALGGVLDGDRGSTSAEYSGLLEPTFNTAVASLLTAAAATAAVLPIAYLMVRHRSRLGGAASTIVTATFSLPGLLIALAMFFWTLRNPWARDHLRGSLVILIFAYMVRFGAQAMGPARVAVAGIPQNLDDAARTLGAGRLRRWWTVERPVMLPGILAGAGLVLMSTMKELPITLLVAPFDFPTLTSRIFLSFEDAFISEAGLLAIILVVLSGVLTWALVIRRAESLD